VRFVGWALYKDGIAVSGAGSLARISALYSKIRKIRMSVVYRVSSVFQVLAIVLQPSSSEL
jgi:hypothetical protein